MVNLTLLFILSFLLGASLASFAGCYAWRFANNIPRTIPRSFCESCGHTLSFWQLIPIAGFVLQGGRCAFCRHSIPVHETAIELLFGTFCARILLTQPAPLDFPVILLSTWLLFLAWCDALKFCVPAVPLYSGSIMLLLNCTTILRERSLSEWLLTAMFFLLMKLLEKRQMFGAADTFVCVLLAAMLGIHSFCLLLFLSCTFILCYFIVCRKRIIPFIPFLFCAYMLLGYFAPEMIHV